MITEYNKFKERYFPIGEDRWDKFYDYFLNLDDSNDRDIGLMILDKVKNRNYICYNNEYDDLMKLSDGKLSDILFKYHKELGNNNTEIVPVGFETTPTRKAYTHSIKCSTITNYYVPLIRTLTNGKYNYYMTMITRIKGRKLVKDENSVNCYPLTNGEYVELTGLKNIN